MHKGLLQYHAASRSDEILEVYSWNSIYHHDIVLKYIQTLDMYVESLRCTLCNNYKNDNYNVIVLFVQPLGLMGHWG